MRARVRWGSVTATFMRSARSGLVRCPDGSAPSAPTTRPIGRSFSSSVSTFAAVIVRPDVELAARATSAMSRSPSKDVGVLVGVASADPVILVDDRVRCATAVAELSIDPTFAPTAAPMGAATFALAATAPSIGAATLALAATPRSIGAAASMARLRSPFRSRIDTGVHVAMRFHDALRPTAAMLRVIPPVGDRRVSAPIGGPTGPRVLGYFAVAVNFSDLAIELSLSISAGDDLGVYAASTTMRCPRTSRIQTMST